MSRYYQIAFALLLFIVAGDIDRAAAHPYLPLEEGRVTLLDYHFRVEGSKVPNAAQEVRGEMTLRYSSYEEKFGKRYLRQTTSYRDIPYMSNDQLIWRREEDGNVYVASMLNDKWNETLELPKDVSIGAEWDYFDGEKSRRKVTRKLELKLAGGEVLTDCLEVTRSVLGNEKLKSAININYYCRDKGDSGFLFRQASPLGEYITETKAKSFGSALTPVSSP